MISFEDPTAPRQIRLGIAGHDAALDPILRVLQAETRLDLYRFALPDLEAHHAPARLLAAIRAGGFDAVHFAAPLRGDITDLFRDSHSPVPPGRLVDTLLLGEDGRATGCDSGTRALEEELDSFLLDRPRSNVLIVGAGTEGQSAAMALARLGVCQLTLHDRDTSRAAALANLVNRITDTRAELLTTRDRMFRDLSRPDAVAGWIDGIVNATPAGSSRRPGQAVPPAAIQPPLWVVDMAASEGSTPLSQLAESRGCGLLTGADVARRRARRLVQCSQVGMTARCCDGTCEIDLGATAGAGQGDVRAVRLRPSADRPGTAAIR